MPTMPRSAKYLDDNGIKDRLTNAFDAELLVKFIHAELEAVEGLID